MAQSFVMNGGTGVYSYTENSEYQKESSNAVHKLITEAISKSFDTKTLAAISNNTFCVVDLGCSVGPNTFFNMQTILEAIQKKHTRVSSTTTTASGGDLEFQVFFNDHVSNDFNTLFAGLPATEKRRYFATGVPGSFYDQLFPSSSIHFAFSSYSLPWLTKVPEKLLDPNSPAWNGNKFHGTGAAPGVRIAYAGQFEKDMESFLNARANEIVPGGMMALITPGIPDTVDPSDIFSAILFDFVQSSLVDMMDEGIINETLVSSFNMPIYCPSAKEMATQVKKNGCFSIESLEMIKPSLKNPDRAAAEKLIMHVRAAFEGVFTKHFGSGIVDEVFRRTLKKSEAISLRLKSAYLGGTEMSVVLKRK